jgi:hypothetical protein
MAVPPFISFFMLSAVAVEDQLPAARTFSASSFSMFATYLAFTS